jgi:hypothetical protein
MRTQLKADKQPPTENVVCGHISVMMTCLLSVLNEAHSNNVSFLLVHHDLIDRQFMATKMASDCEKMQGCWKSFLICTMPLVGLEDSVVVDSK